MIDPLRLQILKIKKTGRNPILFFKFCGGERTILICDGAISSRRAKLEDSWLWGAISLLCYIDTNLLLIQKVHRKLKEKEKITNKPLEEVVSITEPTFSLTFFHYIVQFPSKTI